MFQLILVMSLLSEFEAYGDEGLVPICVIDGIVKYASPADADVVVYRHVSYVKDLPNVTFSEACTNSTSTRFTSATPRQLFVAPANEGRWYKIGVAWSQYGILPALTIAFEPRDSKPSILNDFLRRISNFIKKCSQFAQLKGNEENLLPEFGLCKKWQEGLFRIIKWHPHTNKFAVVTSRDDVHIYSAGSSTANVLKYRSQQYITSIDWRPFSASELAVGCSEGIYIWNIDPNSMVTKPSSISTVLLSKPNHKYITSVAWNKQGNLLVSTSLCDRTMYVWDVSMEIGVPLQRYGGGNPVLASWSPKSEHLFVGTTNSLFRIWSSIDWSFENWYAGSNRVKCVCWSPDGSVLLFATILDPIIYAIVISSTFNVFKNPQKKLLNAVPIADVGKQEIRDEIIGGEIVDLKWDPTGAVLAVLFKDSNIIPIFTTTLCPQPQIVRLSPKCVIRGRLNEVPNCIDFQKNVTMGCNLTIAWSTGRVQYFPIYA